MQFRDFNKDELKNTFLNIKKYLENFEVKFVRYLDLGCKVVRLVGYSEEYLPQIEKQLTFGLRKNSEVFHSTLYLWKETDFEKLGAKIISRLDLKKNLRLRLELIRTGAKPDMDNQVFDENYSSSKPVISIEGRGIFAANDFENQEFYYGVKNLEPEELIKEGHLFVQFFNNILKTETSNMAHGAVIGLNGDGILMCARGQRGKSTLSVLSMMEGFEYVSDDYLTIHKDNDGALLTSPIYSIITLSPKMYNELYDRLDGSRFVSNNARKDKYVFNISNFHDRFKINYPIKICLFPEIVTDKDPSIRLCTQDEKGRAMVQLIQSTVMQTNDWADNVTVKKMLNMIKDFPFYKFHLCHDIKRNTEFLRDFMNNLDKQERKITGVEKIAIDITFDYADIMNTQKGILYSINKFATNVFENLLYGASVENVKNELLKYQDKNPEILNDFDVFVKCLKEKEIYDVIEDKGLSCALKDGLAQECNYQLAITEHIKNNHIELIKEKKENELCVK